MSEFLPPLAMGEPPKEQQTEKYIVCLVDSSLSAANLENIIHGIQTVSQLCSLPHRQEERLTKAGHLTTITRHQVTKNAPAHYPWASKKGWISGDEPYAEYVKDSLNPEDSGKYIVIQDSRGEVVAYTWLECHPHGTVEKNKDNFQWTDSNAHEAFSNGYIEAYESAIHPAYRKTKDQNTGQSPADLIVQAREEYARQRGFNHIFAWAVSTHLPNEASAKYLTRRGYKPVCTVNSYSKFIKSTGYYKHLS